MRAGSECAVKTTCASVPRTRDGEELDEPARGVPALDEAQLGAAGERALELLAVAGDREARVVRRENEADDDVRARRSAASAASAMRGVQCFIPVKTGKPSSRSSAARVSSVIAFSGFVLLDPSRR